MTKNRNTISTTDKEAGFTLVELMIVVALLVVTLGVIISTVTVTQQSYAFQRQRMEAINDGGAAVDMLVRLIRNAGNNSNAIPITAGANTIHIRADWNPQNGVMTDRYENIEFRVNNGVMEKREAVFDGTTWQPFLENVQNLEFQYLNAGGTVITDPVTSHDQIVSVQVTLTTTVTNPTTYDITPNPSPTPMIFTSRATVRRRI